VTVTKPAAAPPAPAPPAPAPTPAPTATASTPMAMAAKCPVGDHSFDDVYTFLQREIAESAREAGSTNETREIVRRDAELMKQPDMKPRRASTMETELSHALSTLCAGTPGCKAVGLYDKSGLAIALSSNTNTYAPLGFVDAAWPKLQRAEPGSTLEIDGETYIVFPVKHGVALCIIDK
jgi:hypothetical protein